MSNPSYGPGSEIHAVANAMRIDAWTEQVVEALTRGGVRSVLLKGPVISEWLYGGDRAVRSYNDADLLISADQFPEARAILRSLGFERRPADLRGSELPLHAEVWFRWSDHAAVDLHRTLHYVEGKESNNVWNIVTENTEPFLLCGHEIEAPNEVIRSLHAVLHIRRKDGPGSKAWRDLQRALDVVQPDVWTSARGIAKDLGVERAYAHILSLFPNSTDALGNVCAEELVALSIMRDPNAPPSALLLARLSGAPRKQAIRILSRTAFPPVSSMRTLDPAMGPHRRHVLLAYARRGISLIGTAIDLALYSWRSRAARR